MESCCAFAALEMACNPLRMVYPRKDVDKWLLCHTFGCRRVHLPLNQQLVTALSGQTVRRVLL